MFFKLLLLFCGICYNTFFKRCLGTCLSCLTKKYYLEILWNGDPEKRTDILCTFWNNDLDLDFLPAFLFDGYIFQVHLVLAARSNYSLYQSRCNDIRYDINPVSERLKEIRFHNFLIQFYILGQFFQQMKWIFGFFNELE